MTELESFEREAYETFVTAIIKTPDDEQALTQALSKFIPGSDLHDYLYLVMKLNHGPLNEKDQVKLDIFVQNRRTRWQDLEVRAALIKYDHAGDNKQEILASIIKDTLKLPIQSFYQKSFSHEQQRNETQVEIKNATLDESIFQRDIMKEINTNLANIKPDSKEEYILGIHRGSINLLPPEMLHTVDFTIFKAEAVLYHASNTWNQVAAIINPTFMSQIKSALLERQRKLKEQKSTRSPIDFCMLDRISIAQVNELFETLPGDEHLIGALFSKTHADLLSVNQGTNHEKFQVLEKLYAHASEMPFSFQQTLLRQIVALGPAVNQYDSSRFLEVVKFVEHFNDPKAESMHKLVDWTPFLQNVLVTFNGDTELQYLTHFAFVSKGDLSTYKQAYPSTKIKYIEEIEDRVRIWQASNGLEGLNLNSPIDSKQFKRVADQVSLKFLPHTKDKFRIDELVELWLEVKNVQTLHCKVFEFNTLTYYRKTLKPFDSAIDLDGLESQITKSFEFTRSSNITTHEKFEFPELSGKVGLFIIELLGNGTSARAVIKKGSLSLIHKSTVAGHYATILDEDRQVCKGLDTGLWLENKFYKCSQDGSIYIPYRNQQIETKVIMLHNGFAQLGEFTQNAEQYTLECEFFLNSESVLVGSSVSILIIPKLMINGRRADLKLLKNICVTVGTVDYIDNIPTQQQFANLKIGETGNLTVALTVPAAVSKINVDVSCSVLNTTNKELEQFKQAHVFNTTTFDKQIHEYHLKLNGNDYQLYCLGKNGEPKPGHSVTISFIHKQLNGIRSTTLVTDESGTLYLGKLSGVTAVNVQNSRTWHLANLDNDEWSYPEHMDIIVGGSLEIPVSQLQDSQLSRQEITLIRTQHGSVIEDWFDKIKVVDRSGHYYLLKVDDLQVGDYLFNVQGKIINVQVHQGKFLAKSLLLKKNCIQQLETSNQIVAINKSQVTSDKVKLQLANYGSNCRVHIVCNSFVPWDSLSLFKAYQKLLKNQMLSTTYEFTKWTNLLLSDRKLSDEYRYVFDRTNAERSLGNSLERPSLLNKRQFVRKTEMLNEVLAAGSKFDKQQEDYAHQQQRVMGHPVYQSNFGASQSRLQQGQYITDYQNFLKDAPLVAYNLKPDSNGVVTYTNENLNKYSYIQITVVDDHSVMQCTKSLNKSQMPAMRDLTLKKALNESKGMTEQRNHKLLLAGESDFIDDITSSSIMIIDDLTKVQKVLTEVGQLSNQPSIPKAWQKLNFISKWGSYTKQQKDFYFSEYQCHEVNFFIYKHDTKYFTETVKPFLANKLEKSFIDLYLLQLTQKVIEYSQMHKLAMLNAFEKCLLIEVLVKNDGRLVAQRIARQMDEQIDVGDQIGDRERSNRIFDLVLNMNSDNKLTPTELPSIPSQPQPNGNTQPQVYPSQQLIMAQQQVAQYLQNQQPQQNQAIFGGFGAPAPQGGAGFDFSGGFGTPNFSAPYTAQPQMGSLFGYAQPASDFGGLGGASNLFGGAQFSQHYGNNMGFGAHSNHDPFSNVNSTIPSGWGTQEVVQQQRQANFNKEKYQQQEASSEYMETFYYDTKYKGGAASRDYIPVNKFWCDYARYVLAPKTGFVSYHFTQNVTPVTQFLTKVLMDLPQTQQQHSLVADNSRGLTITVSSNAILLKKEIKEVAVELQQDFMVTHRYKRTDEYGIQNQNDDEIISEFVVNVPYECEVIMTNVSPNSTAFNLLYQVPIGSMPINQTKFMKSMPLQLDGYSTQKISFQFYFPKTGQFSHYPSNVSIGDKVTARGEFNTLNVVANRTIATENVQELNFDDLVNIGTKEQILEFLQHKNLHSSEKGFQFQKINHLLQIKDFWSQAIQILRDRSIYSSEVWRFGLQHLDVQTTKEYLMRENTLTCIQGYFSCSLYETSPSSSSRGFSRMLEYNPMINARAHAVGQQKTILNKTFRQTYDSFLQSMATQKQLTYEDQLILVYYLQLQDRIPEAIALFQKVQVPKEGDTLELQYDYLCAYFDFFTGQEDGYKLARRIVQRYDDYPVASWKMMFLAVEDQLNDFDGEFDQIEADDYASETGSELSIKLKQKQNLKDSKIKEPLLSNVEIDEKGQLSIESKNIATIQIKYYLIDAEILFSRAPFLSANAEEFSYVKPCHEVSYSVESQDYITKNVDLPAFLINKNLVIEVVAEGFQVLKTFYSCALKVQINEAFGELKVLSGGQALGRIYVKVFSRDKSGVEAFYRDGYTDIRGKFEYATGEKLAQVDKFAILIQSETQGSMIKEVSPPKTEHQEESIAVKMQKQKMDRCNKRNDYVQSKRR